MKLYKKILCGINIALLTNLTMANNLVKEQHFKDLKKTSMKCFVELAGGNNAVFYHHDLPIQEIKHFEKKLLAFNLKSNTDPKNVIYKIHECVKMKKRFKDLEANRIVEKDKNNG